MVKLFPSALVASLLVVSLHAETPSAATDKVAQDRQAILAMAGEYKVSFSFTETLQLEANHQPVSAPYAEEARELVILAEDTPERITLQHLLVIEGGPIIKHWAQIWTYQDTRLLEYQGDNSWKLRDFSADQVKGTWSQLVTQIDDSPRYESFGTWVHEGGVSQWVSQNTFRPLPRREHTKREDYNVLAGLNVHTITSQGWLHEQWNTKTLRRDGQVQAFARETGLNRYDKAPSPDFQPAKDMWAKDGEFWKDVRAVWDEIMKKEASYRIADKTDVPQLRKAVLALKKAPVEGRVAAISEAIKPFLNDSAKTAAASEPAR